MRMILMAAALAVSTLAAQASPINGISLGNGPQATGTRGGGLSLVGVVLAP